MSLIDKGLYDLCLSHHRDVRGLGFVVRNSLPIPYFGDVAAYMRSPLKLLTAALNPSDQEFPDGKTRFDIACGLQGADELEEQLSAYFKANPYRQWFSAFEPVLRGLGASYGGQMAGGPHQNTALHLDMCSPIATSPTWSSLGDDDRSKLTETGRKIYEALVDELKPDLVVASLGWDHIRHWDDDFSAGRTWESVKTYDTTFDEERPLKRPLRVQARRVVSQRTGHSYLFVNADAANTPFGRFHKDRRTDVGKVLLERVRAPQSPTDDDTRASRFVQFSHSGFEHGPSAERGDRRSDFGITVTPAPAALTRTERDYTHYAVDGVDVGGKSRLVRSVVLKWLAHFAERTGRQPDLAVLTQAFPQTLHGSRNLFAPVADAQGELQRTGHRRHFLDPDHLVQLADGSRWAITNQWGAGNIAPFISRAGDLGFQVTAISRWR